MRMVMMPTMRRSSTSSRRMMMSGTSSRRMRSSTSGMMKGARNAVEATGERSKMNARETRERFEQRARARGSKRRHRGKRGLWAAVVVV